MRRYDLDDHGSFCWLAQEDDPILRTSTALALDDGWLLLDAVDAPELDAALAGRPVLGVGQLLDRHGRDVHALAQRLGVPVLVPGVLAGSGEPLDVPGVQERVVLSLIGWDESALWLPERGVLVCADALGTSGWFLARPDEHVGVHPFLRVRPPRGALGGLPVRGLAVGHGPPLRGPDVGHAIDDALARARRELPLVAGRAARLAGRAVRRRLRR